MSTPDRSTQPLPLSGAPSDTPQPPCECIDGVPLDWSGRGTSHVDYKKSDVLPIAQGNFLGHGMHGGVFETSCNGIKLAWKRKYCRRRIGEREMREIEIIKKLSHRHIIRLIGTYTHGPFLGLLLWPVATCDLASLLEDVDWLHEELRYESGISLKLPEDWMVQRDDRETRLQTLGITYQSHKTLISPSEISSNRDSAVAFLKETIGCIASAVAYLHASNIKHKDLKPSNILLSKDGLWLTDFGTATDFSVLTSSVTDNGERGTPKYFAPEVANFEPSGRSADVFSMGCIFFEIMTLCIGHTLELSKRLRQSKDRSFQSNLGAVMAWFDEDEWISFDATAGVDKYLLGLVRWMMLEEAHERPTADVVENEIAMISSLGIAYCFQYAVPPQPGVYRDCCNPDILHSHRTIMRAMVATEFAINVTIGTAALGLGQGETCTFYIKSVDETYIESVHMFLDKSHQRSHLFFDSPPYEINSTWGYDIAACLVLRPGFVWTSPVAQLVPNINDKRVMPIFWLAGFESRYAEHTLSFGVQRVSTGMQS